MPSTTNFEFGDIVLVAFPFTNQSGQKKRPAVVVSSHTYNQARPDLVLMAVTSQLHPPTNFGETYLTDWRAAGLLKPSAVKPVIFTVEKNLILNILEGAGVKRWGQVYVLIHYRDNIKTCHDHYASNIPEPGTTS